MTEFDEIIVIPKAEAELVEPETLAERRERDLRAFGQEPGFAGSVRDALEASRSATASREPFSAPSDAELSREELRRLIAASSLANPAADL